MMITKKIIEKIAFCLVFTGIFGFSLTNVYAETRTDENVVVAEDEVVNGDLFIGSQTADIKGVVNGDVYIGAGTVTVSGTINGDLIAGAETIKVTGEVKDDVRVAGRTLTLDNATVGDSVTFLGETMTLGVGSKVAGGVIFSGQDLIVDGSVGRDIHALMGSGIVSGSVEGGVYAMAEKLSVVDGAHITGDLNYRSSKEATIMDGATIDGKTTFKEMEKVNKGALANALSLFSLWLFLGTLVTGIILILLFRKGFLMLSERIKERPLRTYGIGVLIFILGIPLFLILFLTTVGIPLALLWITVFIVAMYLSQIIVALSIGIRILKAIAQNKEQTPNVYLGFSLGMLILFILGLVPFLGILILSIVAPLGLGAFAYAYSESRNTQ